METRVIVGDILGLYRDYIRDNGKRKWKLQYYKGLYRGYMLGYLGII